MHCFIKMQFELGLFISACLFAQNAQCAESEDFCPRLFATVDIRDLLSSFDFPEVATIKTSDPNLRIAIYETFNGKDFYTGQPIMFDSMVIDHIMPSSKGGADNIYNYVPTVPSINSAKSNKVDSVSLATFLGIVRTAYAPRVLERVLQLRKSQEISHVASAKPKKFRDFPSLRKKIMPIREAIATKYYRIDAPETSQQKLIQLKGYYDQGLFIGKSLVGNEKFFRDLGIERFDYFNGLSGPGCRINFFRRDEGGLERSFGGSTLVDGIVSSKSSLKITLSDTLETLFRELSGEELSDLLKKGVYVVEP